MWLFTMENHISNSFKLFVVTLIVDWTVVCSLKRFKTETVANNDAFMQCDTNSLVCALTRKIIKYYSSLTFGSQ